jgi:hypothetical protein
MLNKPQAAPPFKKFIHNIAGQLSRHQKKGIVINAL